MTEMMDRVAVIAGMALLVAGLLTWMVGSARERPMSLRWTVGPVAVGVILIGVGILGWAVAA
jgi:hypothetical protein